MPSNGESSPRANSRNVNFLIHRELDDKKQQSVLIFVNFGAASERVNITKVLEGMPDLITVEITGGSSAFKRGDQINISNELELKGFESIVGFYNGSTTLTIGKVALLVLILVSVLVH